MRILLATGIFPPDIGGPAIYSERLAHELNKRNFRIVVVSYGDGNLMSNVKCPPTIAFGELQGRQMSNSDVKCQRYKKYDFKIVRVSRRWPKTIRHLLYFWQVLKLARDADVIYAQNLFSAGMPALLTAKILGKKIVVKIVGDYLWERLAGSKETFDEFQNRNQGWRIKFLKKFQTYLAKRATQIITPSHYLKKIVVSWGVAPEKIAVVYNAAPDFSEVDILRNYISNGSKEEAKRNLGLRGDVLLTVGRLVPWKGFNALIELMPELLQENPHFSLVIIGEGQERKNLESQISRCKLEKEVKLLGKIDHRRMPLYFKAADLFVLNSGYEGLSHVILEAMQLGVPIITTRVGGNPELIEDGENGILVDYNNKNQLKEAIIRLSKDKSIEERLIKNSQEKLKEFNWQRLIDNTLQVLSGYSTSGVE